VAEVSGYASQIKVTCYAHIGDFSLGTVFDGNFLLCLICAINIMCFTTVFIVGSAVLESQHKG